MESNLSKDFKFDGSTDELHDWFELGGDEMFDIVSKIVSQYFDPEEGPDSDSDETDILGLYYDYYFRMYSLAKKIMDYHKKSLKSVEDLNGGN